MKTLITGGTGFVGRALVQALHHHGASVRVLTRRETISVRNGFPPGVELCAGNLEQSASLNDALKDVDTVVHLAAALGGHTPEHLAQVNVAGTAVLAHASARAGVRRMVHMSSAGVYGDHEGAEPLVETAPQLAAGPYERSKLCSEQAVIAALEGGGTDWVILRPAGVYGGQRALTRAFLSEVLHRRWWVHLPPRVMVHPTYIADVIQAIEAALAAINVSREIFNIGGARVLAFDEWVDESAKALGTRVRQLVVPARLVVPTARGTVRLLRWARLRAPARLSRARMATVSRTLDISKARARLGFVPTPFDEALAETVRLARAGEPL